MSELVVPKRAGDDPLLKWRGRGRLPHGETVDAYLARVRDYADTAVDTSEPTGAETFPATRRATDGRLSGPEPEPPE